MQDITSIEKMRIHFDNRTSERFNVSLNRKERHYIYSTINSGKAEWLQNQKEYVDGAITKKLYNIPLTPELKNKLGVTNLVVVYHLRKKVLLTIMEVATTQLEMYRKYRDEYLGKLNKKKTNRSNEYLNMFINKMGNKEAGQR